MKINKLTIHNIASIADAEIDFTKGLLSDAEVFLICGKTGAGKSTILDAITLALYSKTPRLENSNLGSRGESALDAEGVPQTSEKQLMRRGTGECSVKLEFIGNDGWEYTVEWSLRRARNKAEGKMQNVERSLVRKTSHGEELLTKKSDVDAAVVEAVGLEFDEFCRTTMLAQGAFTQFLNSGDNEKADILEKVTGTDRYSEIGKSIYAIFSEKKDALSDLERELENVKPLSEDEKVALDRKLSEIAVEKQSREAERMGIELIIKWFDEENTLAAALNKAAADEASAMEAKEKDDYKYAVKTLDEWNVHSEECTKYNRLVEAKRKLIEAERKLDAKRCDYRRLKSCGQSLAAGISVKNGRLAAINNEISAKAVKKERVYDRWGELSAYIKDANDAQAAIHQENNRQQRTSLQLNQSRRLVKEIAAKISDTENSVNRIEYNIKSLKSDSSYTNLSQNSAASVQYGRRASYLKSLADSVRIILDETAALNRLSADTDVLRKQEREAAATLSVAKAALEAAKAAADTAKQGYDAVKLTIDGHTKTLRASLHVGCTCPVCRQVLREELPSEDYIFASVVAPLEAKMRQTQEDVQVKTDAANQAQVRLEALSHKVRSNEKEILERTSSIQARTLQTIESHPQKELTAESLSEDTYSALVQKVAVLDTNSRHCDEEAEKGRKIQSDIEGLNKEFESLRKQKEDLVLAKANQEKEVAKFDNSIAQIKQNICGFEQRIRQKMQMVATAFEPFAGEYPGVNMRSDEFVGAINAEVNTYKALCSSQEVLKKEVESLEAMRVKAEESYKAIEENLPQWASEFEPLNDATDFAPLLQRSISIISDIAALTKSKADSRAEESRLSAELRAVCDSGAITEDRIRELCALTPEDRKGLEDKVKNVDNNAEQAKALLGRSSEDFNLHHAARPVMEDDETRQSAVQKKTAIESAVSALDRNVGEIQKQLRDDKECRRQFEAKIVARDAAKSEKLKWESLNDMFGSADGAKFRNIAQSYILGNLIRNANFYMRTLMPRYELSVEPGTFVIMVKDSYQGYAKRAVSNISGGESFMVSLALALALADVGSKLGVDTLFIDEGFGTLSGEPLQNALVTLRNLHRAGGRRVGIISHIEELAEMIPVKICVNQAPQSSVSTVEVVQGSRIEA